MRQLYRCRGINIISNGYINSCGDSSNSSGGSSNGSGGCSSMVVIVVLGVVATIAITWVFVYPCLREEEVWEVGNHQDHLKCCQRNGIGGHR